MLKERFINNPNRKCLFCTTETSEDYRFCSSECALFHWHFFEKLTGENKSMSAYELDKDIYKSWFEEKTLAIEAMTKEQVQSRVEELSKMEFLIRREWGMLHQHYDKLTGRKGIPPWLQADRDALIKEPNYKVKFDEPREKKPKAAKQDHLADLGIDVNELKNALKDKKNGADTPSVKATESTNKKSSLIDSIVASMVKPPVATETVKEKVEITESLKDRLARIRAASNQNKQ